MGVVYKAEDTRLKRTVALKFLSRDITGTGDHAERFLREAQAAAALDHPNICTLYEIDRQDGEMFLSMAYLEGEPLDRKIEAGPLALDTACDIARQAAEGLAAAHAAGVVHRDIKSSNIMVSADRSGRPVVKLMDFGLAQVSGASKLTKVDSRLGTVAYMSPEQSIGEPVGPASDLWSLGIVIHEMVSGELPFKGHYDQAILYSILNEEPAPLTTLRSQVPMELEWIVEKCLAKSPADRYQDARELAVDLEMLARRAASGRTSIQKIEARKGPGVPSGRAEVPPEVDRPESSGASWARARGIRPRAVAAVAAAVLALALSFVAGRSLSGTEERAAPTRRFTLRPIDIAADSQRIGQLAMSPDGKNIAFSTSGPQGSLWLQPLDRHDPVQIEGVRGVRDLFWSPNSDFLGYAATGVIGKVALRGLTITPLIESPDLTHLSATWSADGQSIVYTRPGGRFLQVSALGGPARPLLVPNRRRYQITRPTLIGCCSEGEQVLLYAQHTLEDDSVVARRLVDGQVGEEVRLLDGGFPVYAPSGHILYHPSANSSAIWAVPFSPESLEVTGEPFFVAQDGTGASVSADGVLVYSGNRRTGQMRLSWMGPDGEQIGPIGREQPWIFSPRVSPSGDKVLVSAGRGRDFDLWIHEASRPVLNRLTFDDLEETGAIWSPDGSHVAFKQRDLPELKLVPVNGGVAPRAIYTADGPYEPLDWSRDGQYILLQLRRRLGPAPEGAPSGSPQAALKKGLADAGRVPLTGLSYLERSGSGEAWVAREFLPVSPYVVDDAVFSPDGRYVAYESNETEDFQVYVRPFPAGQQRWQVSTNGGKLPRWSDDGSELYFVEGNTLVAVSVDTAEGFLSGDLRSLFTSDQLLGIQRYSSYDVGPQGRFALVGHALDPEPPAIRVVLNWLAEFQGL